MKHWIMAAIVTGLVFIPMIIRKKGVKPVQVPTELDKRYNIDDFLTEDQL